MGDERVRVLLEIKGGAAKSLRGIGQAASSAVADFSHLSQSLRNVGEFVVGVASKMFELADAMVETQRQIAGMSKRTGLAVDTVSALRIAALSSGQSLETMNEVINPLVALLAQMKAGSTDAAARLRALGVDTEGMAEGAVSSDEALRRVLDALSAVPDESARARAAVTALGESGGKLLEVLGSSEELEQFSRLAKTIGVDSGPDAALATDAWQAGMVAFRLSLERIPGSMQKAFGSSAVSVIETAFGSVATAVTLVTELVAGVTRNFIAFMGSIGDIGSAILGQLRVFKAFFSGEIGVVEATKQVAELQRQQLAATKQAGVDVGKVFVGSVGGAIRRSKEVAGAFKTMFANARAEAAASAGGEGVGAGVDASGLGNPDAAAKTLSQLNAIQQQAELSAMSRIERVEAVRAAAVKKVRDDTFAALQDKKLDSAEQIAITVAQMDAIAALEEAALQQKLGILKQEEDAESAMIERLADKKKAALERERDARMAMQQQAATAAISLSGAVLDAATRNGEEMTASQRKAAMGMFLIDRGLALGQIALSTAAAVSKAAASAPPPANAIPIGIAVATGAAQAAAALAVTPQFASGGTVANTGMALVHEGERITSRGGVPTATQQKIEGMAQGGGGGAISVSVNGFVDNDVVDRMIRSLREALGSSGRNRSLEAY